MLRANGGSPGTKSPAQFQAYIGSELVKWRKVVKDGNVKVE